MEDLISSGDMTIYRTCYSPTREANNNKSHGKCVLQNQKGSFDMGKGGIIADIASILNHFNVINQDTLLPFVTLEGESHFYDEGNYTLPIYLKPASLDDNFSNRYERADSNYSNYDPKFIIDMDTLAQSNNTNSKIKANFDRRGSLDNFIKSVKNVTIQIYFTKFHL